MALVVAGASAAKAKLTAKARWRPHSMVRRKMPDGTDTLSQLPDRARLANRVGEDAADDAYCPGFRRGVPGDGYVGARSF